MSHENMIHPTAVVLYSQVSSDVFVCVYVCVCVYESE